MLTNWSSLRLLAGPVIQRAVVAAPVLWNAWAWINKLRWKGKPMEKPFSIKDLGERLRGKGLALVEDQVRLVVEETLGWVQDSVVGTPNKIDDLAVPFIQILKPSVLREVDKIDGRIGANGKQTV